jgi:iron(III) transport system substrate-binding protein
MRYIAVFLGVIFASACASAIGTAGMVLWSPPAHAQEIEDRQIFGHSDAPHLLRVISTADITVFAPVILDFLASRPEVAIDYTVAGSTQVMTALQQENHGFDLAISSAMDLQTKLANDGFARPHRSAITESLPEWARWRDDLFAFTMEPAAIVLSPSAFAGLEIPTTRQELLEVLRQNPNRFAGRIGTYDVRLSGLGYLFATQDARTSESYWRLTEVMGYLGTRLYCCSGAMIDAVSDGTLAVAYNVLGSYAHARDDADRYLILYPTDFTTVMLRTVMIPLDANDPTMAGAFIDHLMDLAWLNRPLESYPFQPLSIDVDASDPRLRRLGLGPGLLVYLDRFKRANFLRAWEDAIEQQRVP